MSEVRRSWRDLAACRGKPTVWWYPDAPITGEAIFALREAKALCAECPVAWDCIADAIDQREQFGIWGGMSPKTLRRLRIAADDEVEWRIGRPECIRQTAGTAA
jgi:hypothetical protein